MNCSPFDLRDYFLKELTDPQQRQVESHVKTCQPCREEMDRLRVTEAALFSLREEEIPQRIAFVSDKIFEPSPWRRWWTGARLGFASAALLSAAILISGWTRPVLNVSNAEIDRRIHAAVAESEGRTQRLVSDIKLHDQDQLRKVIEAAAKDVDYYQRRERPSISNASYGGDR